MGQNFFWSYPQVDGTAYPLQFIGSYNHWSSKANPGVYSITIPSTANFLVVCLAATNMSWLWPPSYRGEGVLTFNGIALSKVGSDSGKWVEIWYIKNPPVGTYSLIVPNSSKFYLRVTASWYSTSPDISLCNSKLFSGTGNSSAGTITVPQNSRLLAIDCTAFSDNYPLPIDGVGLLTLDGISINAGSSGGVQIYAVEYKIFDSLQNTNITLGRGVDVSTHPWQNLIAVFTN